MVTGVKDTCPKPIYNYAQSMREMQIYAEGKDKKELQAILPFISSGRTIEDFTESNVAILDIDETESAETIWNESRGGWMAYHMPSIFFIQKSFSGKMHIGVRIPMVNDYATYKRYVGAVYEIFNERYVDAFDCRKIDDKALDKNALKATQLSFISANDISFFQAKPLDRDVIEKYASARSMDEVFGYLKKNNQGVKSCGCIENVTDCDNANLNKQDEGVKSCGCIENVTDCESDTNYLLNNKHKVSKVAVSYSVIPSTYITTATFYTSSFENNVKVPHCDNQIVLDFTCSKNMLDKIIDDVIDHYKEDTEYRITLYRPAIYYESVYSVKLKLYKPYNKDGALKIRQGGKRRLNIKKAAKVAVLNYIASVNYGNKFIHTSNIIATIKHYILNYIETNGSTRKIDDDMVVCLIKELKNNWKSIQIEYSTNSFWYKKDKDEDNVAYMHSLQRRKNLSIDSTAKSFIDANCLGGIGYGKIAEILNTYSIASKTKKGWSEFSVGNIFRKDSSKPESAYKNRIDELIDEGLIYKDIAKKLNDEGYTTKQGKEFNEDSIKNYMRTKNNSKNS